MSRFACLLVVSMPLFAAGGCGGGGGGGGDGGDTSPSFPFQHDSPWPKFRGDAAQTARSSIKPQAGGKSWAFPTGKGIFSSPIVGADGTIYIGSADRYFYAINADGSERWKLLTGEIIDSGGLLDDRDHVYFGSGDGKLRALGAGDGKPVWTFEADAPKVNAAYINWFEGNVALAPDGHLYVPNDNFFVYSIDRDAGTTTWRRRMNDQTWSLPAVDGKSGRLVLGNNNVVPFLGSNVFGVGADNSDGWDYYTLGTVAASPMLLDDGEGGRMAVVGSFDGFVYAFDLATGALKWRYGTRDHIYASPALTTGGDGVDTIVQPSADGTVYGLDRKGALRWTFSIREPIRSSPAVDGDGNVFMGTGDGRLVSIDRDGKFRFAVKLIEGDRNDLNSSPAIGARAVYLGGETGEVFSVPFDLCSALDPRCQTTAPAMASSEEALLPTSAYGSVAEAGTASPLLVEPNQPLVFSLSVRKDGGPVLAYLDAATITATTTPVCDITTEVSGDGKFVSITPRTAFVADAGGKLRIQIAGNYLVDPAREGLKLSGGTAHPISASFDATLASKATPAFMPAAPTGPGDPSTTWEMSRLALPLPTLLPSYNQIGFDSLHYLIGLVELSGGHGVAWMVGAKLADGENKTVIDPDTRGLLPLEVTYDAGAITFDNQAGLRVVVMNATIPFKTFRLAAGLGTDGNALLARLTGSTKCAEVPTYGAFLQKLGLCNPTTDVMTVAGASNFRLAASGPSTAPSGLGTVAWSATKKSITATLSGTSLKATEHLAAILLVDPATGKPVTLDYGPTTMKTADGNGLIQSVTLPIDGAAVPSTVRAYLMVDTYPAAKSALTPQ